MEGSLGLIEVSTLARSDSGSKKGGWVTGKGQEGLGD